VDKETGYRTRSILAVPVLGLRTGASGVPRTLAVIQMINKTEFDGAIGKFDEEDVQVMETFATFVASKLEQSSLLAQSASTGESEAGKAFDLSEQRRRGSKRGEGAPRVLAIAEAQEEAEEAEEASAEVAR